jgi:hypothetical protein
MAALTPANVIQLYQRGDADMVGLFGLRNVNTNDTIDVATVSAPPFQVIKRAVVMGVSEFIEIAANFAGTVVTMPAGMAGTNSSGYLLVWGC